MATTITRGYSFGVAEQVTNTKLHNLVDDATASIDGADLTGLASIPSGAGVIPSANLPKVSGAALTSLASIPSGAGVIPAANLPSSIPEETAWADYSATSTIVGWTSFTVKYIYTKKIGNTVFVQYDLRGTSDSATTTFTIPYTSVLGMDYLNVGRASDNGGTYVSALNYLADNTSLVYLYKDPSSGAFTASGTKSCQGQFYYEVA